MMVLYFINRLNNRLHDVIFALTKEACSVSDIQVEVHCELRDSLTPNREDIS